MQLAQLNRLVIPHQLLAGAGLLAGLLLLLSRSVKMAAVESDGVKPVRFGTRSEVEFLGDAMKPAK